MGDDNGKEYVEEEYVGLDKITERVKATKKEPDSGGPITTPNNQEAT